MKPKPPPALSQNTTAPGWLLLAVFWLAGFSLLFFLQPLPNLGSNRVLVWEAVPGVLLDWVLFSDSDPTASTESRMDSGWNFLPQRLAIWSWAGFLLCAAWGIGHFFLWRFVPSDSLTPLERFVFSLGLGLSILSLMTLLLGVAGWLFRGLFLLFLTAGFLAGLARVVWGRWRKESASESPASNMFPRKGQWAIVLALLPFLGLMLLGSVTPSTDFDVKEYHFGGPKEFFLLGRVQFLEHNVYTSFPFLTEMLTLLGMVVKHDWYFGALVGKTVLMMFIPLTGLLILAAGRRWFSEAAGWLGMLVWLTTPWAARIAIIAYAEGGLTFYLFAAFYATGLALEQLKSGRLNWGLFFLAGLLAGSAMACKYTGLVSVVFPMAVAIAFGVFRFSSPKPRRKLWFQTLGVFGLGVGITIGPWLIKNLMETGNPVYPLAWSVFGGTDWDADLNAQWSKAHRPPHHRVSSWFLLENGKPGWIMDLMAINDWLSPLLYGLAPLALLVASWRKRTAWIWLFAGWLFLSWWGLTHRLDRFWVPMLPVIALLAGAGAAWNSDRLWKIVCTLIIAKALLFNVVIIGTGNAGYISGLSDLNQVRTFTARLTAPEIEMLNQLSENSLQKIRVLSVGDAEVFDARFPIVYNTVFDRSIFQQWTAKPDADSKPLPAEIPFQSPEAIRARFREEGITHVLVNWQEILRYRPTYGYAEFVHPGRFSWLVEHGVLEEPQILNRQEWEKLSAAEQKELIKSGWRESLRDPGSLKETVILSAVYRVR